RDETMRAPAADANADAGAQSTELLDPDSPPSSKPETVDDTVEFSAEPSEPAPGSATINLADVAHGQPHQVDGDILPDSALPEAPTSGRPCGTTADFSETPPPNAESPCTLASRFASGSQFLDPSLAEAAPPPGGGEWPTVAGYQLLGELGRGGMGVVYKARQRGLRRLVALKMVLAGSHAGPRQLERFYIEAEAVARLQHPNIVQIYEVGEDNGLPFFSLEFVDGAALDKKIGGKPQPVREAAQLTATLARAMHFAHGQGILHRDLKPANVLLTKDGVPKITDFGLAKRLEEGDASSTKTGTIM